MSAGVKEINLVAQDLTAFGQDRGDKASSGLVLLLRTLSTLSQAWGSYWLRLLYAFPSGVSNEFLEVIADSPVLCKYLDLPLQHISGPVLKRMKRPLGEARTRKLIEKIKNRIPSIALRTTFLLGFPGESEADVCLLQDFVEEGHFTHVGVFAYSPEPEAKANCLSDQLEEKVREERRGRIMLAQQKLVLKRLSSMKGNKEKVLILGSHPESSLLLAGRTVWQGPETDGEVIINEIEDQLLPADLNSGVSLSTTLQGKFAQVEITGSAGYDLLGKIVALE